MSVCIQTRYLTLNFHQQTACRRCSPPIVLSSRCCCCSWKVEFQRWPIQPLNESESDRSSDKLNNSLDHRSNEEKRCHLDISASLKFRVEGEAKHADVLNSKILSNRIAFVSDRSRKDKSATLDFINGCSSSSNICLANGY